MGPLRCKQDGSPGAAPLPEGPSTFQRCCWPQKSRVPPAGSKFWVAVVGSPGIPGSSKGILPVGDVKKSQTKVKRKKSAYDHSF